MISAPLIRPLLTPHTPARQSLPPRFAGIVEDLHKAGVTRQIVEQQWNAHLWLARYSSALGRLTVAVTPKDESQFDRQGFSNWLTTTMQTIYPDLKEVTFSAKNGCCRSHCSGCLARHGDEHDQWYA